MFNKVRVICKNCARVVHNQGRGLCSGCYRRPEVREQFPANERYAASHPLALGNAGFSNDERKLPPCPTSAIPGSEAKIQVMIERLLQGYHLHHPLDPKSSATAMEVLSYVS
jgi:hypothetical protein